MSLILNLKRYDIAKSNGTITMSMTEYVNTYCSFDEIAQFNKAVERLKEDMEKCHYKKEE